MYTKEDVLSYVAEEEIKFIRLAFCDIFGKEKNITILPEQLNRAFSGGICFDASAIRGFGNCVKSDLFLVPDPATLSILPWHPVHSKVIRMFCDIRYPDGRQFERDCRYLLKKAVAQAKELGLTCNIGAEFEFYLFQSGDGGEPTKIPYDHAGYMDIYPEDRGETVRREICFSLLEMGIAPEASHHEEGPSQHEIDFKYSDALTAADNATTFKAVVKAIAMRNGLTADFSPKPLAGESGNGLHINISVLSDDGQDRSSCFMAGILQHIRELSVFLNPTTESYQRLGEKKAPRYVTWSHENRSQLIRIPAATGAYQRIEVRSPDPTCNPYLAFALLLHAGMDGVRQNLMPDAPTDQNLFTADKKLTAGLKTLPATYDEAYQLAQSSSFVKSLVPEGFVQMY